MEVRQSERKHDEYYSYEIEEEEEEEEEYTEENKFLQNLIPIKLTNYEPVKHFGSGSFSNTIEIKNKETQQIYSAKIFNKDQISTFSKEVMILSQISHPSITKYIGYSKFDFDGKKNPMIITDYYENDNLSKFLAKGNKPLNNTQKMIVVYGIASSMSYLHSKNILHRNLKPSNISMDKFLHPKISGFDISTILKENEEEIIEDGCYGTISYIAPEIFKDFRYTKAGDVYAFSMILYQIFVKHSLPTNIHIITQKRPSIDVMIPPAIKKLIESCWDDDFNKRPTFESIVTQLKTDEDFIFDGVDKEAFFSYINMIDDQIKKEKESLSLENQKMKSLKDDDFLCISCDKPIKKKKDCLIISGFKYHKRCVKCSVCNKRLKKIEDLNDFVCITPGLFICKKHYGKYQLSTKLSKKILNKYRDKMVKNSIKQIFQSFIFNNDEEVINKCSSDDIFIDSYMVENSYHLNDHYKYFVPTATFHFDCSLSKIKIIEFIKLLPKETMITNIEQGSTIITIAFLLEKENDQEEQIEQIKEKCKSILKLIQTQIQTPLGKSSFGNLINEPILKIPTKKDTQEFFKKDYVNILQNFEILEEINCDLVQKNVQEILAQQMNKNWEFIFNHFDLFERAEKEIREGILNNGIEMIIIGETIIANKYYDEYKTIKEQIIQNSEQKDEDVVENILYHGTKLSNHQKIIEQHFLMPDEDEVDSIDGGYFGRGIYATNNIFYASIYSNNYQILGMNNAISVICCQCICSRDNIVEVEDMEFDGQPIPAETKNKFGIHQAFVGSENGFHIIDIKNSDKNLVVAYESVFPNKFQIIPICSFTVLRTSFFVLWADENGHYSTYLNEVKSKVTENIYYADNYNNVKEILNTKKRNPIKMIISSSNDEWIQKVIGKVRKIFGENIICLVLFEKHKLSDFDCDENVICTSDIGDVILFSQINIYNSNNLKEFIQHLEDKYHVKFNLDKPAFYDISKLNSFKFSLK